MGDNMKNYINRIKLETFFNGLCALALTSGCVKNAASNKNSDSNVANVSVRIPDSIREMTGKNNSEKLITGYKLSIQADKSAECKFDDIREAKDISNFKLSYKLNKNCSYLVNLSFGKLSDSELSTTYFALAAPQPFSKLEVSKENPVLSLTVTDTESFATDASDESKKLLEDSNSTSSKPKPEPEKKPLPVTSLELVDSTGKPTNLENVLGDAQYYFLTFSTPGCIDCPFKSDELEKEQVILETFSSSPICKYIILAFSYKGAVFEKALVPWLANLKSDGAKSRSFGVTLNDSFVDVQDSPTYALFKRTSLTPIIKNKEFSLVKPAIKDIQEICSKKN